MVWRMGNLDDEGFREVRRIGDFMRATFLRGSFVGNEEGKYIHTCSGGEFI